MTPTCRRNSARATRRLRWRSCWTRCAALKARCAACCTARIEPDRCAAGEPCHIAYAAVTAHCDALPCAADTSAPCPDGDASAAATAWAAQRGVRAALRAASFDGMRGAAATRDICAGEAVAELPAVALLTADLARAAPGLADAVRDVDDDTAALLWTMRERLDAASPFAPLWASLPHLPLHTGLTLPPQALAALEGTLLHEETRQLQAAARQQYDSLFPALCDAFPSVFAPRNAFTFDAYLAAAELWQAYAVRVVSPSGQPRSALLPEALLLNHGLAPHVVRFSAPDADGVLRLRALRRCAAGAQLFLSYGPLPNSQLLLFYGFTLDDNPYDTFPLAFELPDAEEDESAEAAALRAAAMQRWQLGVEHSLRRGARLPSRLLGALRLLTASGAELADCARDPRLEPLSAENEATVAHTLAQTVDALLDSLPAPPEVRAGEPHAAALAHCATYLRGQRDILLEARQQCAELLAALDA